MRDVAFGRRHVLGDAAAQADDLDLLVLAFDASGAEPASGVVRQEGVEIGMAHASVLGRANIGEVNSEFIGAGANGRAGEDFRDFLSPQVRLC